MKITNKIEILETVEDGRRYYKVIVNGTVAHEESALTTVYNRYPTTLYRFIDYVCYLVGWTKGNIKYSLPNRQDFTENIRQEVAEYLVSLIRESQDVSPRTSAFRESKSSDTNQAEN